MSIATVSFIFLLGLLPGILFTSLIIPVLKHKQAGQSIRTEGPEAHQAKAGTPTMGGIAIIIATLAAVLVAGYFSTDLYIGISSILLFGLIGFLDDYIKTIKKENLGLRAWQKFSMQFFVAAVFAIYIGN
ncbi:MAG: phospho-N-acetylmuramoyl-pentapeptide-transferase, partial [Anaerovoracaceae bacterium]